MSPTPLTEMPSELVVFLVRSTCLSGNASCSTSSFTLRRCPHHGPDAMTFCVEICLANRHEHGFGIGEIQLISNTDQRLESAESQSEDYACAWLSQLVTTFFDGLGTTLLAEPLANFCCVPSGSW